MLKSEITLEVTRGVHGLYADAVKRMNNSQLIRINYYALLLGDREWIKGNGDVHIQGT